MQPKQTVGSMAITRPNMKGATPLTDTEWAKRELEKIPSMEVYEIFSAIFNGAVGFLVEENDRGTITIGTALSIETRGKILKEIGDKDAYLQFLKSILPNIDSAFNKTFSPIEDWLDEKYLNAEINDRTIENLKNELFMYNSKLGRYGYKDFNFYLVEELLNDNIIQTIETYIGNKNQATEH